MRKPTADRFRGVGDAGHVIHLFWRPDGEGWRVQDLTQMAMG